MKLWMKILIALVLGIITGLVFGEHAQKIGWIGDVFLKLINMILVLLVFSSMTVGITSIHDPQKLGRVGLKTLALYFLTTVLAISIGLLFAKIFQPGAGMNLPRPGEIVAQKAPSMLDHLLFMIPEEPIRALTDKNYVLQVIVFSLFLGISINFSGEKGRPLLELLESLSDVMYRLTSIVMELSPYGIFAIMASTVGEYGPARLVSLGKLLLVYYVACTAHVFIVFCSLLWFMAKLHPGPFFKGMGDAIMVAFSTSSSSATLPVSMHCLQENLGVSKNISSFVLPLGSTINMNGAALYQGMAVVFIAQAYGIELDWQSILTIVVTATLSAVGAAGVPGSGYIMLNVVFSSVGLPMAGVKILASVDRIREMGSTVLNVLGDAVCAVYVAKQEGELDERQYYHEELVELEGSEI